VCLFFVVPVNPDWSYLSGTGSVLTWVVPDKVQVGE